MFLNLPFLFDSPSLAVVPVFVNAGAALLPALLGGSASALALLFKPKELLRVCRKKPHVPLIVVAGSVLLFFLIRWMVAFIGSGFNGGGVVALKIAEGLSEKDRLAWKTDTPFPATGSVTLHDGLVLVGCETGGLRCYAGSEAK